jgi:hypothetical protein
MALPGLLVCLGITSGCALHYYDSKTGTEHLWGIGHQKMKVIPHREGVQAVIKGTESLGVSIGHGAEGGHFTAGWDYRRRIDVGSNAAVRLEWPTGDYFNFRVGTKPPFLTNAVSPLTESTK